tara:strand:- start:583 stop:2364 length:1782 start_codon:yes stop_codon:yes gene_type:complete
MSSISVTGKEWIIKKFDNNILKYFKENFFLDEFTSRLLAIRKIDKSQIKNFLDPTIKNSMPNPKSLKDMDKAIERIFKSIKNNELIGIFGDYDVDGASSTALLGNYFKLINQKFLIHIPDRKKEGYGPSKESFKKFIDNKVKLILTLDCGTLSFEPIEFSNENNIDVVVFDHHQSEINLPKAYSIINPNRIDDQSNLNYLCAAGVCFMFLVGLNKRLREENWFKKNKIKEPNLMNFLDLVSLGTICDVVPLIGLNRAIVKQGLKIIRLKKNLGIKTLIDICNIETNLTTYHLGYVIGPRINAGGRVGKSSHGANLLLNYDSKETFKIATELESYNRERKFIEETLSKNIMSKIKNDKNSPIIILSGDNWHEGVIGIIASRIKDKFNKPSILISFNDNIGKASCRSTTGIDIGSIIIAAVQKKLLIKGGGHKMAGGFSILKSKLDDFEKFIVNKIKLKKYVIDNKKYFVDAVISPAALNLNFYEKIEKLSPFGPGNPEPRLIIDDVKILNSKIVGGNHVKSLLYGKDGSKIPTIAFNSVDNEIGQMLLKTNNNFYSIAGKLSLNEWKGKKKVEFIIDDISVNKNGNKMVPSSIG